MRCCKPVLRKNDCEFFNCSSSQKTTKRVLQPTAVEQKAWRATRCSNYSSTLAHNYGICTWWCTKASTRLECKTRNTLSSGSFTSHLRVVDAAGNRLGPRAIVAAGRSRGGQPFANHEARVARHLYVVSRLVVELEGRNAAVLRVAGVWAPWLA
jgi:hypothetical protein